MQDKDFINLYEVQYPRVVAYARRRLGPLPDAEDCAAEVFRLAWEQETTPSVGWLFVTARNITFALQHSRTRLSDLCSRIAVEQETTVSAETLGVLEAMDQLPEPDRELLMAYYWDDLSGAQCAALLGCTTAAVWVRLHRARTHIRSPQRMRWLAPSLAAVITVTALSVSMVMSPNGSSPVPWAMADTISASVVDTQISSTPYGTSILIDIPLPTPNDQLNLHWIMRMWLSDGLGSPWKTIPDDISLTLHDSGNDSVTYLAQNWPIPVSQMFTINGPDSRECTQLHADGIDGITVSSNSRGGGWTLFSGLPYSNVSEDTVSLCDTVTKDLAEGFYGTGTTEFDGPNGKGMSFTLSNLTTDPDYWTGMFEQFQLGPDGTWTATPPGEEDTASPGMDTSQRGFPYDPAKYSFANSEGDHQLEVIVADDGTCIITVGAKYAAEYGITVNQDGTCSYHP